MTMAAVRVGAVILLGGLLVPVTWAGNVLVIVTDGGAAVSGAQVEILPHGLTGTTNAAGRWQAMGVPGGECWVVAWRTVSGNLRGDVCHIAVPADGNASVACRLVQAMWLYRHLPYAVGDSWRYREQYVGPDGGWTKARSDVVERATTIDGESAVVIVSALEGEDPWEETRSSTRAGFVMYTTQDGDDTMRFDPPLRLPPLLPLGHWQGTASTAHHSDHGPDSPVTLRCRLTGFESVTVPAGAFRNGARLEIVHVMGARTNNMTLWTAQNVGIVRRIEVIGDRRRTLVLEEYHVDRRLRVGPELILPRRP